MPEVTLPQLDGGLNLQALPYKIEDNQSPAMLNMWYKDKILNKRFGQIDSVTNLQGPVLTIYEDAFNGYGVVHAANTLYKWDLTNAACTAITNTVSNIGGTFFPYGDNLYYKDGVKYWTINSGLVASEVSPYIPVVMTGCTPTLSVSTPYEDYNLIGNGFETWYTADGTNTYTLPQTSLTNTTAPTVLVNGVANTNFTTNYTSGKITFTSSPTNDGVIDGVRIKAYATVNSTQTNMINNCTLAIPFGGESSGIDGGTRIFVSGNTNYPTTYWKSGLKDPTYFPETQDEKLDNNSQPIKAFGKQNGELIVFKSKSVYAIRYNFDATFETILPEYSTSGVTFPMREIHSHIGCDMPKSVQLIDNRLVFANTYKGVFILDATDKTSENNIKPISNNILGSGTVDGLLDETNAHLIACSSVDFDRKYWLNVGGNVYMWDYDITSYYDTGNYEVSQRRLSWFLQNNIYANAFFQKDGVLYIGRSDAGTITKTDNSFADNGVAINGYWQSKVFDFNLPQYLKTVYEVLIGLQTSTTNTTLTITYLDEKKTKVDSKTIYLGWFSYDTTLNYDDTYNYIDNLSNYAKQIKRRPKIKKIVYFSIKLSNNTLSKDLGISNVMINYIRGSKVK